MLTIERQTPYSTINHPAQEDWLELGRAAAEELCRVDSSEVAEALATASIRADVYRQMDQTNNLNNLRLTDRDTYSRLAGHPELTGEHLQWFARAAFAAFIYSEKDTSRPNKIALDLGGIRQLGDWSLAALDILQAGIPSQVRAADPKAAVRILERPGERHISYKVLPIILDSTEPDVPLRFGLVRRRRGVADIHFAPDETQPGMVVQVFKESTALYNVDEIEDEHARAKLAKTPRQYRMDEKKPVTNSSLASAAGRVFEAVIKETPERRKTSKAVVPVGTHILMLGRRPTT